MPIANEMENDVTSGETGAQAPPKFLRPKIERMPSELKQRPNWLLWVPIWNGSKWTKRPIQVSGFGASTTNPKHWSSFDDVKQTYEHAVERGYIELREKGKPIQQIPVGGVGFVFDGQRDEDGLVIAGVDFDKVISADHKEVASLAVERIERLGSYCERSVSGYGLHVIVKAHPLPAGVAHGGVELYTKGRFFTMTGRAPEDARIVAAPDEFAALAEELRAQSMSLPTGKSDPSPRDGGQTADAENAWFGRLPPEKQSEVVKYAALHIANNSRLLELTKHGGSYQEYFKLALAIARSGVPDAENIFVEAASIAKDPDPEDKLREFFQNCERAKPPLNGVTIGTLLHAAQQSGADFDQWKRQLPVVPPLQPSFVDPYAEFIGPAFPLDVLPTTLSKFVDAEHRAMGADPSAIAMAALTAVAGAMHAETVIRAGEGWLEKPILWTASVGQPSTMKSPIFDKTTKPLIRIDHERDKSWRQQDAMWRQLPKATQNVTPRPPKPLRCVIMDATPEKVAEILSRDPSGSLMVHDELAGWLGGFDRYNSGQPSRAFYLKCWNGGTHTQDRVGKGKRDADAEIHVDNLALCILGGIQPDRLAELPDLASDGLLQRFLPVLMAPAERGDDYYRVAVAEDDYEKLIKTINNALPQNYHFADEAFEVRDRVMDYLHKLEMVDGFSSALIGAIGKLKGYFARICLVLHVARQHDAMNSNEWLTDDPTLLERFPRAEGERLRKLFEGDWTESLSAGLNSSTEISRRTAEAAEKVLRDFLLQHIFGLYDVVVNGGQDRDMVRSIGDFILASNKDRLRQSDLTSGVRKLRGQPEHKIREWAGRFCAMGWLQPVEEKPGVPPKAWLVVSGLREHFAERRKQAQDARAEAHAILKAGGSRRTA
jgi:Protein of unknown function (DUF3987)